MGCTAPLTLTAQEKALEFMFFDLSSCVQVETGTPELPPIPMPGTAPTPAPTPTPAPPAPPPPPPAAAAAGSRQAVGAARRGSAPPPAPQEVQERGRSK